MTALMLFFSIRDDFGSIEDVSCEHIVVVLCSLFVVRCSLFVVLCSLFVVRCSLFVVRCSFNILNNDSSNYDHI